MREGFGDCFLTRRARLKKALLEHESSEPTSQEAEGGFQLRGRLRVAFPVHEAGGKKIFVARSLVA